MKKDDNFRTIGRFHKDYIIQMDNALKLLGSKFSNRSQLIRFAISEYLRQNNIDIDSMPKAITPIKELKKLIIKESDK